MRILEAVIVSQSCEILSVSVRDRCAFLKARLLFPLDLKNQLCHNFHLCFNSCPMNARQGAYLRCKYIAGTCKGLSDFTFHCAPPYIKGQRGCE